MEGNNNETLIALLSKAMEIKEIAWEESKNDQQKWRVISSDPQTKSHDIPSLVWNKDGEEDYINAYIGSFSYLLFSLAKRTVKETRFPDGGSDQLDPENFSEWVDHWPIIHNPQITNWLIKWGATYPSYALYIYSLEEIRNLLIKIKNS